MRHIKEKLGISLVIVMALALVGLSGCKKDDPQPETERVKSLLVATQWNLKSVTVDDVDKTSMFTGFSLSFNNTGYTTTNGGLVWPASGTWTFEDNTGKTIIRNDGLKILIDEITTTSLKLSFTRSTTTLGSGRVNSLAGNYEFSFVKN